MAISRYTRYPVSGMTNVQIYTRTVSIQYRDTTTVHTGIPPTASIYTRTKVLTQLYSTAGIRWHMQQGLVQAVLTFIACSLASACWRSAMSEDCFSSNSLIYNTQQVQPHHTCTHRQGTHFCHCHCTYRLPHTTPALQDTHHTHASTVGTHAINRLNLPTSAHICTYMSLLSQQPLQQSLLLL